MKTIELCGIVLTAALVGLVGASFVTHTKGLTSKRQVVAIDSGTVIKTDSITAQGKLMEVALISEEDVLLTLKGTPVEVLGQVDRFTIEATKGKPLEQYTSQVYSFLTCQTYTFIDTVGGTRYLTSYTESRYNLPQGTPLAKIKESITNCSEQEITSRVF